MELQAEEVYVLLQKNYRISRNIRLNWFFNNILKDLKSLPRALWKDGAVEESSTHEIQVLSWSALEKSDSQLSERSPVEMKAVEHFDELQPKCTLQPETKVCFVSRGYRLVFALDLSPSIFQVSTCSMRTIAEDLLEKFAKCLCSVIEPFTVPHSEIVLQPRIHVTVFAQTRQNQKSEGRYKQDIIVQGCLLTPGSIASILKAVECKIYHRKKACSQLREQNTTQFARHDHGLVSMMRTGLLALQLLPSNTSAGIILITDGVVGVPDMAVLETLANQLRCSTVSCSVIQLEKSQAMFSNYTYCPSVELLKFISSATYGTFYDSSGSTTGCAGDTINPYQKGLLIWQFQLDSLSGAHDVRNWEPEADLRYTPKQKNMFIAPLLRKKQLEKYLRVPLFALLSVRLREGYMVRSMSLGNASNQLEIELVYLWNHSASVKYHVTSAWPVMKSQVKVEVFIEGTYEFLFDVTMGVSEDNSCRYRVISLRRFAHFRKGICQTDHMLSHLLSFASDIEHYRATQKHVPLFYLHPHSNQLVLSMQSETDCSKFSAYWKPILSLDTSIWQKWLHAHHVDIVLQHDTPLPKHLHVPSKSGRFHSVQSSTAMSQVASFLREWCTFVLLENHSYIKFFYKENEETPSSFYIVRLSNKTPVVIMRFAFLIGTPGLYRNQIVSDLRDRVLSLTFPSFSKQAPNINSRTGPMRSRHSSAQTHSRYLSGSERPCVTFFHKPLDRVVIRYDQAPRNFLKLPVSLHRRGKSATAMSTKNDTFPGGEIASTFTMLDPCRYLQHRRSVWSVTNRSMTFLPPTVTGHLASLLVKLRLSEGFTIASTSSGVINMIREFPMSFDGSSDETYHCLSQYILFPPTSCTAHESSSLDGSGEDEEDRTEPEGELLLSAEVWIEPQCGVVIADVENKVLEHGHGLRPPSRLGDSGRNSRFNSISSSTTTVLSQFQPLQRFVGLLYSEISRKILEEDQNLLSVLVTMEHLRLMCVPDSSLHSVLPQDQQEVDSSIDKDANSVPEEIIYFPGLFNLPALLDRCPRTKLLFMTLSNDSQNVNENCGSPNDCLFNLFYKRVGDICDREALLSKEDSRSITQHMIMREKLTFGSEEYGMMNKPPCDWKCFLKVLPRAKVMVIFFPATFRDLKNLISHSTSIADIQPDQVEEGSSTTKQDNVGDAKLTRRMSMKRIGSVHSGKSGVENPTFHGQESSLNPADALPVFVYECSTSSVVELVLKDPINLPGQQPGFDVEHDYRIKSVDCKAETDASKVKFFRSQSYPSTPMQRNTNIHGDLLSPPPEDVFASIATSQPGVPNPETAEIYESLVDAYHRCFVRAVSNNLRQNDGRGVVSLDVQAATDAICVESVQEIDITQFLLITCPQIAAFKTQHLSQEMFEQRGRDDVFTLGPVSEDLQFSHRSRTGPMKHHSSSTSSNPDSAKGVPSNQVQSPELSTKGSRDQISGNSDTAADMETVAIDVQKNAMKQAPRSAFKKLRKRPHSLPVSDAVAKGRPGADADGDTPETDLPSFLPVELADETSMASSCASSLPRSVIVEKPLKRLPVLSKVGWGDLPEFPIRLLKEMHPRHMSGTDDQVQMNFLELLSHNFHSVQDMPEIFYYNPQDWPRTLLCSEVDPENLKFETGTAIETDQEVKFELSDSLATGFHHQPQDDYAVLRKKKLQSQNLHDIEDCGNYSHSGSSLSSVYSENDKDSESEEDCPLFLCMTCTVRDKKTGNHGTMLVEGLPTNLQTILSHLESPCESVDLSELFITLDLIWMVLPAVAKKSNNHETENKFSSGLLPEEEDSPAHEVVLTKQSSHMLQDEQEPTDPLASLHSVCINLVKSTKSQVEWLLEDEIISALRTYEAIDESTLEKVAAHVETSTGDNCLIETIDLQFIFGPDKSFHIFNDLIEKKLNELKGYRMKREGKYCYYTTERTFLPIPHWPPDPFLTEAVDFQRDFRVTTGECDPNGQHIHPFNGSSSSGEKPCTDRSKEIGNFEHTALCRRKTAPDSVQSPLVKLTRSAELFVSLSQPVRYVPSGLFFQSLPNTESMSVDAIESDVVASSENTMPNQTGSSKSTPVRKTFSALDVESTAMHLSGNDEGISPNVHKKGMKYWRGAHSRLSLPTSILPGNHLLGRDTSNKAEKKRPPVKQKSMESNLNASGWVQLQHSSQVTTPHSLRNSPLHGAGPSSPFVARQSHNSSLGSVGSAPTTRRRSMNNVTPITHLHFAKVQNISKASSSTPMVKGDDAAGNVQVPMAIGSSAHLLSQGAKDATASPVSLSDGEIPRLSTASWLESGYDGEESDLDGEDYYTPSLGAANDLPSFWLIVRLTSDNVKLYFHRRNGAAGSDNITAEQVRCFSDIRQSVQVASKCVNQTLLLSELHDSRMCNALLVEETEEDIWRHGYQHASFGIHDDHENDTDQALLVATMKNAPGQYACDLVLETVFNLHPRLRTLGSIPGKSSVLSTVRELVINLMVSNRKDMFVYMLSDKSVFYCRMEQDLGHNAGKADSRRSSQLLMASSTFDGSMVDLADRRTSRESLTGSGLTEPKTTGTLTLRWYGVGPLSPQQKQELNKMNERIKRRLDDTVLEKIAILLQRNSKLSSSDIDFIQPTISAAATDGSPAHSRNRQVSPNATLVYGLPDEFSGCLSAVRYYLHQNLLPFLAMPRYADATQLAGQFVAYKMQCSASTTVCQQQLDSSVYLFNQAIEPGKTEHGIACVVLEITDAEGNQVATDTVPKLSLNGQMSVEKLVSLTEVLDFQEVVANPPISRSSTPAIIEQHQPVMLKPTSSVKAYVRFHLWIKGTLTLEHLHSRLRPAIRHSLFDTFTELVVLRSRLSEMDSSGKHDADDGDVIAPIETQRLKNTSGKTDAMRSLFGSLNDPASSIGRLLHSGPESANKEDRGLKQNVTERKSGTVMPVRRRSAGTQAAESEIGNLKEVYHTFSKDWFTAMEKANCTSVFRQHVGLGNMSPSRDLVCDMQKILMAALAGCKVKLYLRSSHESTAYISVTDGVHIKEKSLIPRRYPSYIIIARNFPLWMKATQSFPHADHHTATTIKFLPFDSTLKPDQSPRTQDHRFLTSATLYIPRQQFVILYAQARNVEIWGYNVTNEIANSIQGKLLQSVNFHIARRRALDCVTFQKLSLFHHCTFEVGFSKTAGNEGANPFTQDAKEVDVVLANSTTPTENERQNQRRSKSNRRAFFNEAYSTTLPVRRLSISPYFYEQDTAAQYAKQYMEMKGTWKKKNEEQQLLQRMFLNWRERPASASYAALTIDVLSVLLCHARVVHHVTSPILFSSFLRKSVLRFKFEKLVEDAAINLKKDAAQVKKRHKRASGVDRKSGDLTGKLTDDMTSHSRSNSTRRDSSTGFKTDLMQSLHDSLEESHFATEELQKALILQYVQYWQSMNFALVKDDKRSKNEKFVRKSNSMDRNKHERTRSFESQATNFHGSEVKTEMNHPIYLYRASVGGIAIVELSFVGMSFSVKLHIIDATNLQHQAASKLQMSVLFLNDCEHLKDISHLHSFMYDFHLRYVQMYIQERQTAIKPGYHLVSLLQGLSKLYRVIPVCASNQIYHGIVDASCSHVAANQLFEYLVGKQAVHLGFKTLKLVHGSETSEHALVSARLVIGKMHATTCVEDDHESYDIGYVIWHDADHQRIETEEKKIRLSYFLLFTNRRHLFPRLDIRENRQQFTISTRRGSNQAPKTDLERRAVDVSFPSDVSLPVIISSTSQANTAVSTELPTTETIHMSPVSARKFQQDFTPNMKSSDSLVKSPFFSAYRNPEAPFTSTGSEFFVKKRLLSQGRRQSMPDVRGQQHSITDNRMLSPTSRRGAHGQSSDNQLELTGAPAFVLCEISRLEDYVVNTCASAEIQCYKNQLWDKVCMDKISKPSSLPLEDFEHLLKHCQMIPLEKLDKRGNLLCDSDTMGIQWVLTVQKHMLGKFDNICRYFTNADNSKRYLSVLNPKLYLMMFLITVETTKNKIGMYVVVRDKMPELENDYPDLSSGEASLVPLFGHMHNMIDFICYHTWSVLCF